MQEEIVAEGRGENAIRNCCFPRAQMLLLPLPSTQSSLDPVEPVPIERAPEVMINREFQLQLPLLCTPSQL